jgi:LuxR family maltose regulon positive regulatory protein
MATLLRQLRGAQEGSAYLDRLLAACERRPPQDGEGRGAQRASSQPQRLIDPLSGRELEILRLLATDLSGPEVARHLVVSLSTVRTHTRNIYAKLGVNTRRAAVRRASDLDLLAPAPPR